MNYNINLNIAGKKCVIIGGGSAAAMKAERLIAAGADVYITAPEICGKCRASGAAIIEREYEAGDTDGAFIVFALTDNEPLNRRIEKDAKRSGALRGGVDFSVSASYSGKNISAAVTTGYPKLSAKLAEQLMAYDDAAGILADYRKAISELAADKPERDRLLSEAVTKEMLCLALSDPENFRRILFERLNKDSEP